jgi:DNA polymerase-3 subunit delta'
MSFKDIYGHEKQIRLLKSATLRNRLSHAYLFSGKEGIGKRTIAEVFAKALNCEFRQSFKQEVMISADDFDSCDRCSSCIKANRHRHSDIVSIKADGQFIKIKEIREIQEQMTFAPIEGGKRIFIVPDADKMNHISANALLKTLEEPSRSNILILITSSPQELPVTIVSRCQTVRFNPLTNDVVASFLKRQLSMDDEKSLFIASSAGGSIGKALAISEDSYLTIRDEILRIMLMDREKEPLKFLERVSSLGRYKDDLADTLNILLSGYRDALVYRETEDEKRLVNQQCADMIKSVACKVSVREILQNIRTITWAMQAIDRNANKQLTLEAMLFKFVPYRS